MSSTRLLRTAALAALACLLFAGCGGGESEPEEPAGFEADAADLCTAAAVDQVEIALAGRRGEISDAAEQSEMLYRSAVEYAERFAALEAPEESADSWARYVETRERAAELVDAQAKALAAGEETTAREAAGELEALLRERDAIGAELGIDACARVLPAEDVAEIEEAIELGAASGDGDQVCSEVVSEILIEERFEGNFADCVRAQSTTPLAEAVRYERIYGIDEVLATAEIELSGGLRGGGPALVQLIPEEGAWRILEISPRSDADG